LSLLEIENFAAFKARWVTLDDGRHVLLPDSEARFSTYNQARSQVDALQQKGWKVVQSGDVDREMKTPRTGKVQRVVGKEWIVENPETGRHMRILSPHPMSHPLFEKMPGG